MAPKTRYPILNEFARKLREMGKDDLLACLGGGISIMDSIKMIADKVGCDEYPDLNERMDIYLNKLWPYIERYEP